MQKLYLLVDVESTGVNFLKDRVFDLAMIISDGINIIEKYQRYIKVDINLLKEAKINIGHVVAIDINLIQSEGKNIQYVCEEFMKIIAKYEQNNKLFFVAHNVDFDYNMILQTLIKTKNYENINKFESLFYKCKIDTIDLSRTYIPGLKSYSLQRLVDKFNLCIHLSEKRKYNKHSALLDCEILCSLFHHLKSMSPFEDLVY